MLGAAASSHTHNYAASDSAGGTANGVKNTGSGTADAARHIWFSDSSVETARVTNDSFKYNPVGNKITSNITGNAASASTVVDYGNTSNTIQIGFAGSGLTSSQVAYGVGYTSDRKIKDVSKAEYQKWLGLGSLAYKSSLAASDVGFPMISTPSTSDVKYYLLATVTAAKWGNYRISFSISSRHSGNGVVNIAFGNNTSSLTRNNMYGQIYYYGTTNQMTDSQIFQVYGAADGSKYYLFAKSWDYNGYTLKVLSSSDITLSLGSGLDSIDSSTYGTLICNTTINYAESAYAANVVKDSGDGGNTTFAYSKSGMNYSDYTWMAAWNGKELRAINKAQFAQASHSHTTSNISDFGAHVYDATVSRTANTVLAAPNGSAGSASFRSLVTNDLPNSGVTAGTYGPSANVTGTNDSTISVPQITVNAKGQVTSIINRTLTNKNTDTNSWRPVQNNLTSTSTSDCLSAYQGKVLKDQLDNTVVVSSTQPTASSCKIWIKI